MHPKTIPIADEDLIPLEDSLSKIKLYLIIMKKTLFFALYR